MKVSISLPEEAVAFLDRYAQEQGFPSRSAVVHKAVRLLRASELGEEYLAAWDEWAASGEEAVWESVIADGLGAG